MKDLKKIEQQGTEAVKKMRRQKLDAGLPFMINSKDLSSNQCYLEYPSGIIKLVSIKSSARDFDVIRELTISEAQSLRHRYNFYL